jgi:hypothetical protein
MIHFGTSTMLKMQDIISKFRIYATRYLTVLVHESGYYKTFKYIYNTYTSKANDTIIYFERPICFKLHSRNKFLPA